MEQKRFDILREMVPDVTIFGAMVNPNYPPSADQVRDLELAAPKIGRQLVVAKAGNDSELEALFATLSSARIGALLVASDPLFRHAPQPHHCICGTASAACHLSISRICR